MQGLNSYNTSNYTFSVLKNSCIQWDFFIGGQQRKITILTQQVPAILAQIGTSRPTLHLGVNEKILVLKFCTFFITVTYLQRHIEKIYNLYYLEGGHDKSVKYTVRISRNLPTNFEMYIQIYFAKNTIFRRKNHIFPKITIFREIRTTPITLSDNKAYLIGGGGGGEGRGGRNWEWFGYRQNLSSFSETTRDPLMTSDIITPQSPLSCLFFSYAFYVLYDPIVYGTV